MTLALQTKHASVKNLNMPLYINYIHVTFSIADRGDIADMSRL